MKHQPLTAEQRTMAEEYLKQWRPDAVAFKVFFPMCRKLRELGESDDEIGAEAFLAVVLAARTYDRSMGTSFATHVSWRIRGQLSARCRRLERTRPAGLKLRSLDFTTIDDSPGMLHAITSADEPESDNGYVDTILGRLRKETADLLARKFGIGRERESLDTIAEALGVGTRAGVIYRVKAALTRAREVCQTAAHPLASD